MKVSKFSALFTLIVLLQPGLGHAQARAKKPAKKLYLYQLAQNDTPTTETTSAESTSTTTSETDSNAEAQKTESTNSTVDSGISSPAAPATTNSAPRGGSDPDALVEEEQVVSSRLKKMDISGASPEMSFSGADISRAGYNSVSDLLRDSTISSTGATREDSGTTGAGTATVDLRGLGASNTLVLINGMRMSPVAGADYVNMNLLPDFMIKEMRIIKDDLSSIYGSDAIGGVVNIITHDTYNGLTVKGGGTATHLGGGEQYDLNILGGKSNSRTNFVYALGFRRNEQIFSREREWTKFGQSTMGSPGTYRSVDDTNRIWYADPACPADRRMTVGTSTYCTINPADYSTSLPFIQQMSGFARIEHEVVPNLTVFTEALVSRLEANYVYAPTPGSFTVPAAVAQTYGLPNYVPGSDLTVQYRTVELGNRDTFQTTDYYNLTTGVKFDFFDTWSSKLAMTYGFQRKDDANKGNAITADLEGLLTQPAPGGGYMFMPFNAAGSRGDLSSAYYEPWAWQEANFFMADFQLSGEAFEILNRPVFLTVGQSYVFRDYESKVDGPSERGEILSGAGASGKAQRYFHSTYAQLEANVTQKLDIFLAGRYDKYNDFGDTINPKLGLKYKITNDLLFRSTVGTGFQAPALGDLYATRSTGFRTFIDHKACQQYGSGDPTCTPKQYAVDSEGNENLSEVTSFSYNTGLIYNPSTNLNVSLDFWSVTQKGLAWSESDTTLEDVTRAEAAIDAGGSGAHPSTLGIIMNRDADGRLDNTNPIYAPTLPLGQRKTGGLDLEISYTIPVSLGKIVISEMASYRLWDTLSVFPGLPDRDWAKENWINRWRNTLNISYKLGGHQIGITVVSTDKYMNAVKDGYLDRFHRFDANYIYSGIKNMEFVVGVQNFLGETPPLDPTDPLRPMNTALFSERGPMLFSNVKYTF